jgi:hypothetical protein
MKKIFLFATLIGLMAFSCEKENDCVVPAATCSVTNPVTDMAWLKAEVQRREKSGSEIEKYFYIQQAEYNGQTIFMYNNCCPMCGTVVPAYNCQGELLFYLGQKPEEDKKIRNTKILWKPNNFTCAN